jgi:hypothetical protein
MKRLIAPAKAAGKLVAYHTDGKMDKIFPILDDVGFDIVHPENLGAGLEPLVGLLVSLVLFDGGLNLRRAGRDLQRSVLQLVLVRLVLGLPVELLGILIAVEIVPDVFRTIGNVTGDLAVTTLAHPEKARQDGQSAAASPSR